MVKKVISLKEGERVKPCYYCKGRTIKCYRNNDLTIIVRCEKCGHTVSTPYLTEDSARSCWCTEMARLEQTAESKDVADS